jgi:RNA polymerase sigma factor (sigma-70 family)
MENETRLLRRYVVERSENAFTELVKQSAGLVYFAALRQTGGDTALAREVAQSVFIDLARKAERLVDRPVLASWLYTSTRFAAHKARREKQRRQTHEQETQTMQTIEREADRETDWTEVRPLIDTAICELTETDRTAILMRYFEDQPFAAMGETLGIGESSARMRTERAMDRLRNLLAKKGVTSTTAALEFAISSQAVAATPPGLATTLASGALAHKVAIGGGAGLWLKLTKLFAVNKAQPGFFATAAVGTSGLLAAQIQEPTTSSVFLVYAGSFGVGLLFTLVSAVMGHAFGGHGDLGHDGGHFDGGHHGHGGHAQGHAEGGGGAGDMPGFAPLSPTTLAAFVTAFGGFGMIFQSFEATRSVWISAPLAALGAFAVAAGVFWLFSLIFQKTQGSSEGRVADLVGSSATVITPIAADGVGEIAYVQNGSRYSAPARSENGTVLASGSTVKITRIVGTQFYVAAD